MKKKSLVVGVLAGRVGKGVFYIGAPALFSTLLEEKVGEAMDGSKWKRGSVGQNRGGGPRVSPLWQ